MKKKIIYGIIILIAALAVYRIVIFTKGRIAGPEEEKQVKSIPVKAVEVKRTTLTEKIRLTGDIVGIEVVNVFSQVPGKVHSILIKEGQKVYKGKTLFKVNRDIVGMDYMLGIVESPITGYIGQIMVDKGMTIAPTMPLAQVVNMDRVEAVAHIMEEDINRVRLGMIAEITVEAFPGKIFRGKIYKKSAVLNPMSRTQEVLILLKNPGLKLKHGMFGNISIITNVRKNVMAMPVDSIMKDDQGKSYVFCINNNHAKKVTVETGITVNNLSELKSGGCEGGLVVTLGKENVADGDTLLVYREDAAEEKK